MKSLKNVFGLLMALIITLALSTPAFAAQTGDLTIQGTTSGNKYDLYRVMDLTQAGSSYSYTVNADFAPFFAAKGADWADPVTKIGEMSNDSTALSQLAKELLDYAVREGIAPRTIIGADGSTTITQLEYGYYLLNPLGGSAASGTYATMFSLNTLSGADTTITVKAEYPSVTKQILENGVGAATNEASIGDDVKFQIFSKVPDMTGYTKYFFVVNDTLSKGLTFQQIDSIKVGGTPLDDTAFSFASAGKADGTTALEIVFKNFIQYAGRAGEEIDIEYTARLNESAQIGSANKNEVTITYSNDPKVTPSGDPDNPDKPSSTDPTGTTPKAVTETYTTSLTIHKLDGDRNILTGAAFRIEGDGVNTVVTKGEIFVADNAAGTYWRLTDGTYTTVDPATDGVDQTKYISTTDKYTKKTQEVLNTKVGNVKAEAFVDENGQLTFSGLGAGDYTITEIVTPHGYNSIDPFQITIGFDRTTKTFSAQKDATDLTIAGNVISLDIENKSGIALPSTGGFGTTVFYVLGGILICVAGILLVVKKRMGGRK